MHDFTKAEFLFVLSTILGYILEVVSQRPLKGIAVQTIDWSAAVVIQAVSDVNTMIQNKLEEQYTTRNFNEYTDDEDCDDVDDSTYL